MKDFILWIILRNLSRLFFQLLLQMTLVTKLEVLLRFEHLCNTKSIALDVKKLC